MNSKLFI